MLRNSPAQAGTTSTPWDGVGRSARGAGRGDRDVRRGDEADRSTTQATESSRPRDLGRLAGRSRPVHVVRLAADANYRGETWKISAADLEGRDDATVAIRVKLVPGKADRRAVRVQADYPSDPQQLAVEQLREASITIHD